MGILKNIETVVKKESRKFLAFSFGGIAVFFAEIVLTIFFTEVFGWWYMLSYGLALVLSAILYFIFHIKITFEVRDASVAMFLKFVTAFGGSFLGAWAVVYLFTASGMYYVLAIVVTSIIFTLANYGINRLWVFAEEKETN